MFHHFLLLTVWLGSRIFACPEGWWRSRVTDDLCLTQPQQNGTLIQDSWTKLHWECRKLGATLVSIRTTDEIEELIELVPEKSWIGLASFNPTSDKWQWIRGSSSKEWPLANTTLFWEKENKATVGRLRCGSLRSNGTISVSHCGWWQPGICELRLNEPQVPNLPQYTPRGVNSIQNESICYTGGGSIGLLSKCSDDFKMYVLPASFADIESMLTLGSPCQDDQCAERTNTLLSLPVRHLPNTDRWLDINTNTSVNWTNWDQSNATGSGDCAVMNDDGFWERTPCERCGATSITIFVKSSMKNGAILPICAGEFKADISSSTIGPATVEPGTGRPRPLCPPGTRQARALGSWDVTCLMLSSDRLPWAAAGQRCRAMGGQLASPSFADSSRFAPKHQGVGVWIGLAALSGQWVWNLNQNDGADWLPRDINFDSIRFDVLLDQFKSKVDESGRILCASLHFEIIYAKAENCGRSMRYICELNSEQPPLLTPPCRQNFHILTSDTTSCLSVSYRNVSYDQLNATCTELGGSPFLPSSTLENEILLANGQKWSENSMSAPAPGQDLVWLGIWPVSPMWNSPTSWTKWAPGHPQNHVNCAVVDASNSLWYSLDCSDSRPSGVCQIPAGRPPAPLHC